MLEIDTNNTVGELVAAQPARARVFEKLKIDYCCGGKRPLEQACREAGFDARTVAALLSVEDGGPADAAYLDVNAMGLTGLADHIEATHHVYLRRELPRLTDIVAKVVKAHAERHPEVLEIKEVFDSFAEEVGLHMMKEEQILFPAIRALDSAADVPAFHCGSVANPIGVMEMEHDNAGAALARMRELTNGYLAPEDVCNTFRVMLDGLKALEHDMHQHVHKENNILFPRAMKKEEELGGQPCAHEA